MFEQLFYLVQSQFVPGHGDMTRGFANKYAHAALTHAQIKDGIKVIETSIPVVKPT